MAGVRPVTHEARYRGVFVVTVTCGCGWVSQYHRSRGRARRAHDGHLRVVWLSRLVDRLEAGRPVSLSADPGGAK